VITLANPTCAKSPEALVEAEAEGVFDDAVEVVAFEGLGPVDLVEFEGAVDGVGLDEVFLGRGEEGAVGGGFFPG
jgi:hypothetical protein